MSIFHSLHEASGSGREFSPMSSTYESSIETESLNGDISHLPNITSLELRARIGEFLPELPPNSCVNSGRPRRVRIRRNRVKEGHIPRPPNAWIIYRSEQLKWLQSERAREIDGHRQCDISRVIGDMWKLETSEVKKKYETLATAAKEEHSRLYPDYRYTPNRKSRASTRSVFSSGPTTPTRRDSYPRNFVSPVSSIEHRTSPGVQIYSPASSVLTSTPPSINYGSPTPSTMIDYTAANEYYSFGRSRVMSTSSSVGTTISDFSHPETFSHSETTLPRAPSSTGMIPPNNLWDRRHSTLGFSTSPVPMNPVSNHVSLPVPASNWNQPRSHSVPVPYQDIDNSFRCFSWNGSYGEPPVSSEQEIIYGHNELTPKDPETFNQLLNFRPEGLGPSLLPRTPQQASFWLNGGIDGTEPVPSTQSVSHNHEWGRKKMY